jgi:phage terminase large subunit GpA-like protein
MECWLPLTGRFVGDMRSHEVWNALSGVLETEWLDRDGNLYRPVCAALDIQGDHYPECLEYVRAHRFKGRLHAVRGYGGARPGAGGSRSFGILRNTYVDKTTGVRVQNVDTDAGKSQLANMLERKEPGPGYVHLPCGVNGEVAGGWDLEAVSELTSEYRREEYVRGYTLTRWHKRSARANHRLDCFVYSLAALALARLKIDDCELQRTEAKNVGKQPEKNDCPIRWGAQSGSAPELASWGVSSQVVQERGDTRERPAWGAQPNSGFGDF